MLSFEDDEVLSKNFAKKVGDVVEALAPLVLLLNEMTHPQSENEEQDEEEPDEDEQAEVTAASGKDPEDAENDEDPVEEREEDAMEGSGGIEEL